MRIPFDVLHPIMAIHALQDSYRHLRKNHRMPVLWALRYMNIHRNNM